MDIRFVSNVILLATALTFSACDHVSETKTTSVQGVQTSRNETQNRVKGEYLVTLVSGESEKVITEKYAHFGINSIHALGNGTYLLNIKNDIGPEGIGAVIEHDNRIKAVQPNFVYSAN
jgi:hypothetical protein